MAPRSIWNGTVTFGMVSVPIKLYTATESKSVSFHEVHAKDGSRIEHRRICSKEEKEVPKTRSSRASRWTRASTSSSRRTRSRPRPAIAAR